MRTFLRYAIPALVVYTLLLGGLFTAMLQPPAVFGHIMSKLPSLAYFLFPFEPLWLVAWPVKTTWRRTPSIWPANAAGRCSTPGTVRPQLPVGAAFLAARRELVPARTGQLAGQWDHHVHERVHG
ncbi:MAG TPA: hypothetical protein VKU44_11205 [Terriglobia bacterium]|nr:hypothetical protein [Terriglobia bacterium]